MAASACPVASSHASFTARACRSFLQYVILSLPFLLLLCPLCIQPSCFCRWPVILLPLLFCGILFPLLKPPLQLFSIVSLRASVYPTTLRIFLLIPILSLLPLSNPMSTPADLAVYLLLDFIVLILHRYLIQVYAALMLLLPSFALRFRPKSWLSSFFFLLPFSDPFLVACLFTLVIPYLLIVVFAPNSCSHPHLSSWPYCFALIFCYCRILAYTASCSLRLRVQLFLWLLGSSGFTTFLYFASMHYLLSPILPSWCRILPFWRHVQRTFLLAYIILSCNTGSAYCFASYSPAFRLSSASRFCAAVILFLSLFQLSLLLSPSY